MSILFLIFGLCTPLLPVFGQNSLTVVSVLTILVHLLFRSKESRPILIGGPYALVMLAWTLGQFWNDSGLGLPLPSSESAAVISSWGWNAWNLSSVIYSEASYLALNALFRFSVLMMLASLMAKDSRIRQSFGVGLLGGLGVSILIALAEFTLPETFSLAYRNDFWRHLGRYAGTLSDPNSFGVFLALVLPVVLFSELVRNLWIRGILTLGILVAGALSGSRTFFLAGLLCVIVFNWRRHRNLVLLSGSLLAVVSVIITAFGLEYSTGVSGIDRVIGALNLQRLGETFFSRTTFWSIAINVWYDRPILGSGVGQFRNLVPVYAALQQSNIGLWTDNANSFYLGVLAESGLVGLFALCLSCAALCFKPDANAWARKTVLVFLVLLIFGPHLDYLEISVTFAWILSYCVKLRENFSPNRWICSMLFVVVLIQSVWNGYGLYGWEIEGRKYYRWTSKRALVWLDCENTDSLQLSYRLLHPDIANNPVKVVVSAPGYVSTNTLHDFQVHLVSLSCRNQENGQLETKALVPVQFEVSRTWVPAKYGESQDKRELGAQIVLNHFGDLALP